VSDDRRSIPPESSGTILLVEDTEALQEVITENLHDLGYLVLIASTGEEAIRVAAAHPGPIELLLTDIRMPGVQGPELARQLAIARPGIRIILMSGGAPGTDLAPGVVVLQKPFGREQLAKALQDAIR
jgi:two-component system cell cycle sensor histidine kinase/response regulator CckA